MSHRYGERLPRASQGYLKSSPAGVSGVLSCDHSKDAPATQVKTGNTVGENTNGIMGSQSSHTEALKGGRELPSPNDMNCWTLMQSRANLEDVVIEKRNVSGQARADLETRRLSLIEQITKLERAELKKRDAARRSNVSRSRLP